MFWVFVGAMLHKGWQALLDPDFKGLSSRLKVLEGLLKVHFPAVHNKIYQLGWDITIFAQHFITIMQMETPKELAAITLDLFFLVGEQAIHCLILQMIRMNEQYILNCDETELMSYLKRGMLTDTF